MTPNGRWFPVLDPSKPPRPADRRAFLVCPTDAGRAAQVAAVAILDEQQSRFLAPLTQEERVHLGQLLNRLYANAPPHPNADPHSVWRIQTFGSQ
jgi:hypothetical protein